MPPSKPPSKARASGTSGKAVPKARTGTIPSTGAPPVISGTGFNRIPGRRDMKEYPLTEGELNELAYTGGFGTLFFSLAAFLLGLWIDVSKDIALSPEVSEAERAFWNAVKVGCLIGAAVAVLIAVLMFWRGYHRLSQIKKETKHGQG